MNSFNENIGGDDSIFDEDYSEFALEIEEDGVIPALQEESVRRETADKVADGVKALANEDPDDNRDINIGITVKKAGPKIITGQFFIGFADNLLNLDLKPTEFKIVIYILKMMNFGNLVSLKQSTISKDLSIDKSAVNRAWKELLIKKVLLDVDGHIFFNSNFCAKGVSSALSSEKIEQLKRSNVVDEALNIQSMLNLTGKKTVKK
jgi:hypothetical protein